jgi:hypothetical protein
VPFRPSRITQRGRALGRAINVHTSRLRCSYVTFYVAIGFYIFWFHRYVSAQYVLTRVYVRVFGEPHAPKHANTHTCTCIRYERMETIHRCGPNVVGSQALRSASAFNANIGAWNTASVTTLSSVCAVPVGRRGVTAGSCARSRRCPPYVPFRPSCATRRSHALGRALMYLSTLRD